MFKTSIACASDFKRNKVKTAEEKKAEIYEQLKGIDYCSQCKMILPKIHVCE